MVDGIGGFNFREAFPNVKGGAQPQDAAGIFDKLKKKLNKEPAAQNTEKLKELLKKYSNNDKPLMKNQSSNDSPLDSQGRLKEGWQYNPDTGVYRKKPDKEILINRFGENSNWIDGGSSVREHNNGNRPLTMEHRPDVDNYEPIFEMKDGKLVQTGKAKKDNTIKYY